MFTLSAQSHFTLENIDLSGNRTNFTASANGGIVQVPANAALTITDGAVLESSLTTGLGGAVYAADGSRVYLSGEFSFDGNSAYHQNDQADEDIYLKEAHENAPATIVITGDLGGEDGSILVWAESEHHYKTLKPFARLATGVAGGNLKAFRNARPDDDTDNQTGSWLYGELNEEHPGYVCWNGVKGSRRVILRKVNGSLKTLTASFEIYKGGPGTEYGGTALTNPDGGTEFSTGPNGVYFAGDLNYGIYYLKELSPTADVWYYLIVDDPVNMAGAGDPDPYISPQKAGVTDFAALKVEAETKRASYHS